VNYSNLVMDKYHDLHRMNQDVVERTGEDRVPLLKYITDNTIMDIPNLAPLVYSKYNKAAANAPDTVPPQPPAEESRITSKVKLSIQKATSVSQASELERLYFESIE